MPAAWYGRRLPAEDFPVYLLRARGHDANHEALLQAFFQWQAPWLLLLPDVDREQRRELERCARTQALVVDRQFRLYPEVIDEAFIKAARVEAMLRKRRHPEINQDDVMSTYYIELHPSPTE